MTKISIIKDLETDASNRYEAINTCNYRSDWLSKAKPEDMPIIEEIKGKTREDTYDILLPYLKEKYQKNDIEISKKLKDAQEILDQYKDLIFEKIEKLTKHKIDYDEIKLFITTYPRCPYNREKGYIRLAIGASNSSMLTILTHEILHFQFHKYYSNNPEVKLLNPQQFDTIKESLTFLLNYEFKGVPMWYDQWYDVHKEFRKKLEEYRVNSPDKDFDKLVDYACDII